MDDGATDAASLLKGARDARRMTQAHLAAAAGVSSRTVMRAEKGEEISPESLRSICAVLELNAEEVPQAADVRPQAAPCDVGQVALTGRMPGLKALARPKIFLGAPIALACAYLLYYVIPGLALPGVYARHFPIVEVVAARKAVYLAAEMSRPMDALTGEVLPAASVVRGDWSVAHDPPSSFFELCRDPDYWDFVLSGSRHCRPWKGGIIVRSSTGTRFEASVGPLPGRSLSVMARLLTPNPGLSVRVAFTPNEASPGDGTLWFDPRHLADGQVPRYPADQAFMHVVATRREVAR